MDQANVPLDHASVTHPITQDWLSRAAQALAISTVNAAAIMEIDVAILDTNLPTSLLDALIEQTNSAIALLDTSGVENRLSLAEPSARPLVYGEPASCHCMKHLVLV